MARGCTPGLITRSTWWVGWDEDTGYHDPPVEGDIAINPNTGSCWLIVSVKSSRKGAGWFSLQREGLGIGAAKLGGEGTFGSVPLRHEDYEMIRTIESIERATVGEMAAP
jgi:hypothetical protein